MYALTVKAVVIDNLQGYYDDEEGYDKLVDISNPLDKEKISNFIKKFAS